MKQLCEDCGYTFDWPELRREEWGEEFAVCPQCGSEYFDDAELCKLCNRYKIKRHMEFGLCEECQKLTDTMYQNCVLPFLRNIFTEEQLQYLNHRAYHEEDFICHPEYSSGHLTDAQVIESERKHDL